jgi:hypothetical protein
MRRAKSPGMTNQLFNEESRKRLVKAMMSAIFDGSVRQTNIDQEEMSSFSMHLIMNNARRKWVTTYRCGAKLRNFCQKI